MNRGMDGWAGGGTCGRGDGWTGRGGGVPGGGGGTTGGWRRGHCPHPETIARTCRNVLLRSSAHVILPDQDRLTV